MEINAAGETPTEESPTPSNEKPLSSSDQRRRLLVTSADSLRRGKMWFTVPETIVPVPERNRWNGVNWDAGL